MANEKDLRAQAAALAAKSDHAQLEPILRSLSKIAPDSVEYACDLGWTLLELKRPAEAVKEFKRASARPGPKRWEAYGGEGVALVMQEHFEEASELLKKAVAAGFRTPLVDRFLLHALNEQALYADAAAFTEQLARSRPDAETLFLHGTQLTKLGKFADAAAFQARAVALNPQADAYAISYAQTLAAAGQWREAADLIYQLISAGKDNGPLRQLWSYCLEQIFDDRGESFLVSHLQKSPNDPVARFQLSQIYDHQGCWESANKEIQAILAISSSPLVLGQAGRIALLMGDYKKAEEFMHATWNSVASMLQRGGGATHKTITRRSDIALNPLLYLPVEIGSRELQTRLNMAKFAVAAGFTAVLLGHQVFKAGVKHLPPGVIVYKSISSLDLKLIDDAARAGHVFTAIDEEAFGRTGDSFAVMKNLDLRGLQGIATVFAPGEAYKQGIVALVPEAEAKVVTTGNPRTDLCRAPFTEAYREEAQTLQSRLGRTLLVCTNFGGWNSSVHPYVGVCQFALELAGVSLDSPRGQWLLDISLDLASAECRNAEAIRAAIPALAAAFPTHHILIRPHPVEDPGVWRHLSSQLTNVSVDAGTSLHAQMMNADAIIHLPGCGTGLEAIMLGRPAICLNMVQYLAFPKLGISGHLSRTATDMDALVALIRQAISDPRSFVEMSPERKQLLDLWLARSETPVCETIVQCVVDLYDKALSSKHPPKHRRLPPKVYGKLKSGLLAAHKMNHAASFANIQLSKKRIQMSANELRQRLDVIPTKDDCAAEIESPADDVFVIRPQ